MRLYGCHRREAFRPDAVARRCAAACLAGACNLPPFFFGLEFLSARVYRELGPEMSAQFGIAPPPLTARVKVGFFWALTVLRQQVDRWWGIDVAAGTAFVRDALRKGLAPGGATCTYRFRKVSS